MPEVVPNPYAPPAYNGLMDASPQGYVDVDFTYTYDVVLTALQVLNDQSVQTTNDADFAWRAVVIAFATGAFNVRFSDSQGFYLSEWPDGFGQPDRRRGLALPDLPRDSDSCRRENRRRYRGHVERDQHDRDSVARSEAVPDRGVTGMRENPGTALPDTGGHVRRSIRLRIRRLGNRRRASAGSESRSATPGRV